MSRRPLFRTAAVSCLLFRLLPLLVLLLLSTSARAQLLSGELPPRSSFLAVAAGPEHVELLRAGGLVLYMRHGATDARYPDQLPVELDDCSTQRPLSAAGREQLDAIRGYFARLGVPYRVVISSPFCRAQESAQRVFGEAVEVDPVLRYTAVMSKAEKAPAVARTRELISLPVAEPGMNRVVVAHGPSIAELMDYLPGEGTMVIFRPLGAGSAGGFEYLASIEFRHWPELLRALGLE